MRANTTVIGDGGSGCVEGDSGLGVAPFTPITVRSYSMPEGWGGNG